jgi:5-amino-6-(5-phosphoribosylamino)uracil reductase
MVEGGQNIHTQFLAAGLADELQLVIAPFFIGDPDAPRFVGAAAFPWDSGHRMKLAESRPIGEVALLRYLLTPRALGEQPVAQAEDDSTQSMRATEDSRLKGCPSAAGNRADRPGS